MMRSLGGSESLLGEMECRVDPWKIYGLDGSNYCHCE
jgi:hypothetical protein